MSEDERLEDGCGLVLGGLLSLVVCTAVSFEVGHKLGSNQLHDRIRQRMVDEGYAEWVATKYGDIHWQLKDPDKNHPMAEFSDATE